MASTNIPYKSFPCIHAHVQIYILALLIIQTHYSATESVVHVRCVDTISLVTKIHRMDYAMGTNGEMTHRYLCFKLLW